MRLGLDLNISNRRIVSVAAFDGDFAALAATYGLTARAFFRGDLGVDGTQGTGKATWANQSGSASGVTTVHVDGVGSLGVGLNGKASVDSNGTSQSGIFTMPVQVAPATTNFHRWSIMRINATPVSSGSLFSSSGNEAVQVKASQVSPAANMWAYNNGAGSSTTGVVINQWYRLRASYTGSANDQIRVGAHAPAPALTSNTAPGGTTRGLFGSPNYGTLVAASVLGYLELEGALANFLLFDAVAGPAAQSFWSPAIEI